MDFGARSEDEKLTKRYCYLNVLALELVWNEPAALDDLMNELEVPGKPQTLRTLKLEEKQRLIERQIQHHRAIETSQWYGVEPPDILAAAFYQMVLDNKKMLRDFYGAVKKESDLTDPIVAAIRKRGLLPYAEVPMGTKRADVVGYKRGGFFSSDRIVTVELKNERAQLERALSQMATFMDYSTAVYLACTPALAAEYDYRHASARNVRHWEAGLLTRKLREIGLGLLLVDGTTVHEFLEPRALSLTDERRKEVVTLIERMPQADL